MASLFLQTFHFLGVLVLGLKMSASEWKGNLAIDTSTSTDA